MTMRASKTEHIGSQSRPTLLTPPEVAERFHTTVGNLAQMRYEDRGPAFAKFGRSVLYIEDDVFAWVLATRHVPTHN